MLEIRRLVGEELHEADLIWLQAFERGALDRLKGLPVYRQAFSDRIERFGLWDSAGLQATFQMTNTRLHFGPEAVLLASYISSIACRPASRGRGYGGAGLKYLLKHMHEAGTVLCTTAPFSFDYYRPFGFEWIGPVRCYKVPSRVLQPDPETEHVRVATREDRLGIQAVYRQFAGGYRGMAARDEKYWDWMLKDSEEYVTYTYVYEHDGRMEGYLIYQGGDAEETWLPEFLVLTPRSQRALLGLLRRHEMQVKRFAWEAPADDGLWSQCLHKEMETTLDAPFQGRVVDVVGALNAWRPDPSARGTVILAIEDPCAPWNEGMWKVAFEQGNVSVGSTQAEPQIRMDIQAFCQAFFGVLTVAALRKQERLQAHEETGYQALCHLLAGPPMWTDGH